MYTILPVADQITGRILCSLNYFVSGGETGGDGDPPSEPETLCIQMGSDVGGFNDSVVVEKQGHNRTVSTNHNRRGMEPASVCLPA